MPSILRLREEKLQVELLVKRDEELLFWVITGSGLLKNPQLFHFNGCIAPRTALTNGQEDFCFVGAIKITNVPFRVRCWRKIWILNLKLRRTKMNGQNIKIVRIEFMCSCVRSALKLKWILNNCVIVRRQKSLLIISTECFLKIHLK